LALVAPSLFLWVLRGAAPRRGFLLGLTFGLVLYGSTLYWILRFGELAWVALTIVLALSSAVFGCLAPFVTRPGRPLRTALGLSALWTVLDAVRGTWPLGGFTWGSLGISQVDDRTLLPIATITGVWGVTFLVLLVNALLVEFVADRSMRRRSLVLGVALLALLAPVFVPAPAPEGRAVDIAVVQVDVRVPSGTTPLEEDLTVARRNIEVHRSMVGEGRPDLVLWGEGALDPAAIGDPAIMGQVTEAIREVGAPTGIGAVVNDPDGTQHTSELLFDADGALVDRYDKVHLVPFGEYVPWRSRLSWISAIEQIPVDRVPGTHVGTVSVDGLPPFATPICFENAFPSLPRTMVRDGATFLVVPVNNASYGFTAASDQHLQMSQMRAVETGRWVVDAAVSGVSAFVEPSGQVSAQTDLFETKILRGQVRTSDAMTWYVRLGDWFPWAALLTFMGLAAIPRRRVTARPTPGSLPATPRTLVILPTFNERPTITMVVQGILGRTSADVLVIDDGSPDGTGDAVRALADADPRVRLLERPEKSGLASAYLEGFRLALSERYDLVVEMDSDLSHDPAELPRLLLGATQYDLMIGSRYIPGGSVTNWSRGRLALSRVGNAYARFMLGLPTHDATSGYRVYRRALLEKLVVSSFASDGYGFQIELAMRTHLMGFAVGEAPITFREREHGESKISRRIVVEALWLVTRWGVAIRSGTGP
jgi:apolipoprotein N-acyltransferase